MSDFREVTPDFSVSPQISPIDLAEARERGFTLIVNNRPDGEAPGQPTSAEIEAAAALEGLDYVFIPVTGRPTNEQALAVRAAIAGARGKALAYCRSGTRSTAVWALGELASGQRGRDELVRLAASAGYDLSGLLPR